MNARLIAESSKTAELSKHVPATQGIKYPLINIKTESIKTGNSLLRPSDQEWNTMVQKEESIYKKLLKVWHSRGFSEMLLEIQKNKEEVPSWLWHLSGGTDTVVRWFLSLYGNISPHLNLSREEMINVFSVVSSW